MVFVKRDPQPQRGLDIMTMMGTSSRTGEVGLEIEVEGNKFPKHQSYHCNAKDPEKIPVEWKGLKDGSLRGDDNAEYVLDNPLPFDAVAPAVHKLWKMFDDYGSVLDVSNRTSVHVHLNVQKWHLNRLTSFLAMYYVLEEILTEWCGEHRVGNLFCLRAKDAPAIITHVRNFIQSDGSRGFNENIHHYAGMNTFALQKFGSLEIRSLQGVLEPTPIIEWVHILRRLYELSSEYPDPRRVIEGFSGSGAIAFFERLLGDQAEVVRRGIQMDDNQIRCSLYEGIRLSQEICYCRNWSLFTPLVLEDDPFGRDIKKVAATLMTGPVPSPSSSFNHSTLINEDDYDEPEETFEPDF